MRIADEGVVFEMHTIAPLGLGESVVIVYCGTIEAVRCTRFAFDRCIECGIVRAVAFIYQRDPTTALRPAKLNQFLCMFNQDWRLKERDSRSNSPWAPKSPGNGSCKLVGRSGSIG